MNVLYVLIEDIHKCIMIVQSISYLRLAVFLSIDVVFNCFVTKSWDLFCVKNGIIKLPRSSCLCKQGEGKGLMAITHNSIIRWFYGNIMWLYWVSSPSFFIRI